MSARDELFNELRQWMHEGEARELIDDFAHELAEKIRTEAPDCCDERCGAHNAADLIDPEVSDSV